MNSHGQSPGQHYKQDTIELFEKTLHIMILSINQILQVEQL